MLSCDGAHLYSPALYAFAFSDEEVENTSGKGDPLIVGASIENGIPYLYNFDKDPLANIETGDYVKMNADEGVVEVQKK